MDCLRVTDQDPVAGTEVDEGNEVTITVDCSQVDWENQEGPAWEDFSDAYSTGFDDGCQALFDQSPDGSLYEDDTEYTASDCQDEVPDDPDSTGTELGTLDGCQSVFENDDVTSLNYGSDFYTESDCPIAFAPSAKRTPSSPRKRNTRSTRTAGESCSGKDSDGRLQRRPESRRLGVQRCASLRGANDRDMSASGRRRC
jgi:hypothetical protein